MYNIGKIENIPLKGVYNIGKIENINVPGFAQNLHGLKTVMVE